MGLVQVEWKSESVSLLVEVRQPLAKLLLGQGYELYRPDEGGVLRPLADHASGREVFARPAGRGGAR